MRRSGAHRFLVERLGEEAGVEAMVGSPFGEETGEWLCDLRAGGIRSRGGDGVNKRSRRDCRASSGVSIIEAPSGSKGGGLIVGDRSEWGFRLENLELPLDQTEE